MNYEIPKMNYSWEINKHFLLVALQSSNDKIETSFLLIPLVVHITKKTILSEGALLLNGTTENRDPHPSTLDYV